MLTELINVHKSIEIYGVDLERIGCESIAVELVGSDQHLRK